MTRIVLKRARARDPLAVAQEIITDLRRDNAHLRRLLARFMATSGGDPVPDTLFEKIMATNIGCLFGRHVWIERRLGDPPTIDEFCGFCTKIKNTRKSTTAIQSDEEDIPTGASAPRRGGISSYPEHAPNGPGLGDPIGGPVRRRPAPPQPIPGGNVYDEDGDLIGWRAATSPPMAPPDRVEPRRLLTWGRMGSRLLRVSLGDGRRPPDEIIVRRD